MLLAANGGTQSVTPAATTTYTASATGPGGNGIGNRDGDSNCAPRHASGADCRPSRQIPASIVAGGASKLTVSATHATAVTVTGSDGSSYALAANGGSQSVSPSATTTYTASATGPGGNASAAATVTVTPLPPPLPTVAVTAMPNSIVAGGSSRLTVTATHATARDSDRFGRQQLLLSARMVAPRPSARPRILRISPARPARVEPRRRSAAVTVTQPSASRDDRRQSQFDHGRRCPDTYRHRDPCHGGKPVRLGR